MDQQSESHVGDVDPLQAIEDARRSQRNLDPDGAGRESTRLEEGFGQKARKRFAVPVTALTTR